MPFSGPDQTVVAGTSFYGIGFASKSADPFITCKEESRGGGMIKKKFFWLNIVWRWEYIFAIFFLFVCGFLGGVTRRGEPVDAPALLPSAIAGKTIIIDAGHGGFDPGAVGRSGLEEKAVTLDIAKRLKRYFSRVGVYVIMTREKDQDYSTMHEEGALTKKRRDLLYRVRMANESKADLLLSIHVNSFPQSIWSGAQCFYDSKTPESKRLAEAIQNSLVTRLGPNRRKAQSADYLLLKATKIPSVTVEVGFISNPREEELLADAEYREKLAESIFYGTAAYLTQEARPAAAMATKPNGDGGETLTAKVYPELTFPTLEPGTACLYFANPNNEDLGFTPELRTLSELAGTSKLKKAQVILEELAKGPGEGSALLPCLPGGDWVQGLQVEGTRAVIDVPSELGAFINGGGASELLAIYSLVNTLAVNLNLKEVTILVDGVKNATLGGHFLLGDAIKPRPELGPVGAETVVGTGY
jgi:N-acetylmuramoyl-L-alanine amidase